MDIGLSPIPVILIVTALLWFFSFSNILTGRVLSISSLIIEAWAGWSSFMAISIALWTTFVPAELIKMFFKVLSLCDSVTGKRSCFCLARSVTVIWPICLGGLPLFFLISTLISFAHRRKLLSRVNPLTNSVKAILFSRGHDPALHAVEPTKWDKHDESGESLVKQ